MNLQFQFILNSIISVLFLVAAGPQTTLAEESAGSMSGTITSEGITFSAPYIPILDEWQEFCGKSIESEEVLVQSGSKGIKNVVITLRRKEPLPPDKLKPPAISFKTDKCRFAPHVLAMERGSLLNLINDDSILHNFHLHFEDRTILNSSLLPSGQLSGKKMDHPGIFYATCDIHGFMNGYVLVLDTPYYAVTEDSGFFQISNIPPGEYLFSVWHESLKNPIEKKIVIQPKQNLDLSLGIKIK
ncbi:MAG: hypothetical protein HYR81_00920 [Nitrospirae bacterium]|nr:hypothetical protein [Nitrospirota bacterium]